MYWTNCTDLIIRFDYQIECKKQDSINILILRNTVNIKM